MAETPPACSEEGEPAVELLVHEVVDVDDAVGPVARRTVGAVGAVQAVHDVSPLHDDGAKVLE